jgi:hypothetical protein
MSLVAGIDYSTHMIDVVLIDEDTLKPEWHRYELEGTDAFNRARDVHDAMFGGAWIWENCIAVGIEDPRGYNAGALYRIQGAALACIPRDILVQPWIPSEWRKAVGLKGNASKDNVAEYVLDTVDDLSPLYDWPQDAFDALCIARATLQALERTEAA